MSTIKKLHLGFTCSYNTWDNRRAVMDRHVFTCGGILAHELFVFRPIHKNILPRQCFFVLSIAQGPWAARAGNKQKKKKTTAKRTAARISRKCRKEPVIFYRSRKLPSKEGGVREKSYFCDSLMEFVVH